MVKGVAKHAVIVRSPDLKNFEQAIFILSENQVEGGVHSADEMLNLACNLASKYSIRSMPVKKRRSIWTSAAWFAAGSGLTALALWAVNLLAFL